MLDRKEIIKRAFDECMTEMYAKSQPPADYNQLIEDVKSGKIGKDDRIYERHYLSYEEFKYILEKYLDAYNFRETWKRNIEVVEEYLAEGGHKDKYMPERIDKNGFKHPGYRSYENVKPLKEQFLEFLEFWGNESKEKIAEKLYEMTMQTIKDCKDYYRFDREEGDFSIAVSLGASPTSNPETVKKWWKENKGVDVEIEERNPLLFWEKDYYEEEFEDIMEEEYGENWKKIKDEEWKEEVEEKKKRSEAELRELRERIEKEEKEQTS